MTEYDRRATVRFFCVYFAIIIALVMVYGLLCFVCWRQEERAFRDGEKSFRISVPAEANPYRNTHDRRQWLEGWKAAQKGGNR